MNFPPYTRIIEIHVKDKYENKARQMSERLSETLRSVFSPSGATFLNDPVTGPYAPTVDKVADQYIRTIRLSLKKDRSLSAEKEKLRKAVTFTTTLKRIKFLGIYLAEGKDPHTENY